MDPIDTLCKEQGEAALKLLTAVFVQLEDLTEEIPDVDLDDPLDVASWQDLMEDRLSELRDLRAKVGHLLDWWV